jgi:hypothetical protein
MSSIHEMLTRPELTGTASIVITFVFCAVIAIAALVSRTIIKVRRDANATALKQDMLDRGMSAEEIKTVLEAGTGSRG